MEKVLVAVLESSFTMFVKTKLAKRWAYFVEIASYIKSKGYLVDAKDCLDPKISHGEILSLIAKKKYKLVILLARPETARSIIKLSPFIKQISPKSKILVYGDTANYFPNFFKKKFIDAVINDGDWECGIDDYLDYLEGRKEINQLNGVSCNLDGIWSNFKKGKILESKHWVLPDIESKDFISKELYYSINDAQLSITVSRGCPFNCTFCPAVITFGEVDRRIPVEKIINFIKNNIGEFKSLKFFSPTFTYDKVWVKNFCEQIIKERCIVPWTCTSRPDCLNDLELIKMMGKAGCYKIAIGVETLDKESSLGLKKFNNLDGYIDLVREVFLNLTDNGITPKPLLMLGIPGQNRENIRSSFDLLKSFGAKELRAASYSPRQVLRLKDNKNVLEIDDIELMDKMTFQYTELPGISREEFLQLVYNTDNYSEILK